MKQKAKSLWTSFLKISIWVWLLFSFSMMGLNYVGEFRENSARARQDQQVALIKVDADKLGVDIDEVGKKIRVLRNRTPFTEADKAELRAVKARLKSLRPRMDDINRRWKQIRQSADKR